MVARMGWVEHSRSDHGGGWAEWSGNPSEFFVVIRAVFHKMLRKSGVIATSRQAVALHHVYQVNSDHTLVTPRRHVTSAFDLKFEQQPDLA